MPPPPQGGIAALLGLPGYTEPNPFGPTGPEAVGGVNGGVAATRLAVGGTGPTSRSGDIGGGVGGMGDGVSGLFHQQLLRPPPPVAAAVGSGAKKWASASLTAAAALLEMEPDAYPLPASALLPIPQPAATAAAAADARAPAASHGAPAPVAPPGQPSPAASWMQMAGAAVGSFDQRGGETPPGAVGGGGRGAGGGNGAGRGRGEPAASKANGSSKKMKTAAAQVESVMGAIGAGHARNLSSGSGSSIGSSSTSDLSGRQSSLSEPAATIVEAIAGLPTEQRAEVLLELNRLYPQYAIPPIPSLPATALPAINSLPATLPDGRSQKTCTLCGQVGHNSRSRFCPKRAQR